MAKRNKFNLSNYTLMTGDMGYLYPVQVQEILPGDSVRASSSALIRLNPLLAPVMHPVTCRLHHWFVHNRLTWEKDGDTGWENFITGGKTGDDAQTVPQTVLTGSDPKSLHDYMGVPPTPGVSISALPLRAVNLIWNEFYRDQDLVPERGLQQTSVPQIAWERDYLTTSRPAPQKGPDITIPLGDYAPVIAQGMGDADRGEYRIENEQVYADTSPTDGPFLADLGNATATNVNDWRRAFALQRYQEARMKWGSRFTEYLRFLGVTPSDATLQRPQYLGGGKATLNFSEVLQTAQDETGADQSPVGTMRGHGIAAVRTRPFVRHFNEHGYFITMLSVRPKTIYQDGIDRTFLRQTKEDYWQKELQEIGQQQVYNDEVYADNADGRETFGWQDRYAEYKSQRSHVTAEFRDILDFWHMGRKFATPPALNEDFVQCDATKRIHSTQNEDAMWVMVQNNVRARRLVKKGGSNRIL